MFRGPIFVWNRTLGQFLGKKTQDAEMEELLGEETQEQDETEATLHSAMAANANGEARKRKAKNRAPQ